MLKRLLPKEFRATLAWLLCVHALGLLLLSLLRLAGWLALRGLSGGGASVLRAFANGLWFDNVVACYIMAPPLVLALGASCLSCHPRWLRRAATVWFVAAYSVVFLVSTANIPYFQYFMRNINASVFGWFGYAGTTAGMVLGESSYLLWLLLFAAVAALFGWLAARLSRRLGRAVGRSGRGVWASPAQLARGVAVSLALFALCFLGIRGRTGRSPIRVSAAYYCSDPVLNQLGVAPMFNLMNSLKDDMREENAELRLMDYAAATAHMRSYLGCAGRADSAAILRRSVPAATALCPRRPNVVFIFMESMSADLMQRFGQRERLTPVLDSLWRRSMAFSNFWSAGIHTNQGITATLYAFPALGDRNIMKGTVTPRYTGLPTILHRLGYRNLFFMTHEALYDNMQAFLLTNGFDEIVSQPDYPEDEVVNSFGVSDRSLFRHAVPRLSRAAAAGRPFMAALLTVSNHPPYVISDGFRPRTAAVETQIVEYADWAIGQFLADARREPWYSNTVFVLVGDHGKIVGRPDAALSQSMNHVPLMVFGPGVPAGELGLPATQTDVTPTLLAMLGVAYDDCGFGRNLLEGGRRTVAYSASSQIAARDSSAYYVYDTATGRDACYSVLPGGRLEPAPAGARFDSLRRHAFAVMQTAEFIYRRQP